MTLVLSALVMLVLRGCPTKQAIEPANAADAARNEHRTLLPREEPIGVVLYRSRDKGRFIALWADGTAAFRRAGEQARPTLHVAKLPMDSVQRVMQECVASGIQRFDGFNQTVIDSSNTEVRLNIPGARAHVSIWTADLPGGWREPEKVSDAARAIQRCLDAIDVPMDLPTQETDARAVFDETLPFLGKGVWKPPHR